MQALAGQSLVAYRVLATIGVTSGSVYFCTGRQFLYFNSNTYTPTGGLGEVSPVQEESDAFPRDMTLRLSGVNSIAATGSLSLYEPMRESMFNRSVTLHRAFLDPQTMTMINTPEVLWKGKIAEINVMLEDGAWELRCISALRKTAAVRYFNRETIKAVDSSDTFCDHIDQIPLFKSLWGGEPTYFNGGPAAGAASGGGPVYSRYPHSVSDDWYRATYPTGG